jgi:hypothetical protein
MMNPGFGIASSRPWGLFVFGLFFFIILVNDLLLYIWRGGLVMA